MKKILTLILLTAVTGLAVFGCSQAQANSIGDPEVVNPAPAVTQPANQGNADAAKPQTVTNAVTISKAIDIIQKSSEYVGKDVVLEGKIVQECGAGCWFNLKDSTAVIYVDLAPSNLTIPQKVGSNARVYGVVTIEKKTVYIIGKKVEFI
jgi:hypothetical protein